MALRADVIGMDNLRKELDSYTFCRIEIKRGSNAVFLKYGDNNEAKNDLLDDLEDWAAKVLDNDADNSTLYKLSLSGKKTPEAKGPGTKFLTLDFRLNDPGMSSNTPIRGADFSGRDLYLELGELRAINRQLTAENESLQDRVEELEALQDDEESETDKPVDYIGSIFKQFEPQIPGLVNHLLGKLFNPLQPQHTHATQLSGVINMEEIIFKLQQHDPKLEAHLLKLLTIAETNPDQFKMLLTMLDS